MAKNVYILTGNVNKAEEFERMAKQYLRKPNFEIKSVPEVKSSSPEIVALYKTKDMYDVHREKIGEDSEIMIEDSSLFVEGLEATEIKFLLGELDKHIGKIAVWTVILGHTDGKTIELFKASVVGKLIPPRGESDFGFDRYFQPIGSEKTLSELADMGEKDSFSARRNAIELFKIAKHLYKTYTLRVPFESLEEWNGSYQEE